MSATTTVTNSQHGPNGRIKRVWQSVTTTKRSRALWITYAAGAAATALWSSYQHGRDGLHNYYANPDLYVSKHQAVSTEISKHGGKTFWDSALWFVGFPKQVATLVVLMFADGEEYERVQE